MSRGWVRRRVMTAVSGQRESGQCGRSWARLETLISSVSLTGEVSQYRCSTLLQWHTPSSCDHDPGARWHYTCPHVSSATGATCLMRKFECAVWVEFNLFYLKLLICWGSELSDRSSFIKQDSTLQHFAYILLQNLVRGICEWNTDVCLFNLINQKVNSAVEWNNSDDNDDEKHWVLLS